MRRRSSLGVTLRGDESVELVAPRVLLADDYPAMVKTVSRLNGVDACRQITELNPEMKVIMFRTKDDPDAGRTFFAAGASASVSKLACFDRLSTIKCLCAGQV